MACAAALQVELPGLLRRFGIRRLLDIPCGDFNWMKEVELELEWYIGADLVEELIGQNAARFSGSAGGSVRRFVRLDLTRDPLPEADLVLCRDCLVHFSSADIARAIGNLRRSGSRYLLATTFTGRRPHRDIVTGDWRPLNFERPPFRFPAPIATLDEKCQAEGGRYADKRLALWRVQDLP